MNTTFGHYRDCPVCQNNTTNEILKVEFKLLDDHPMDGGYNLTQCTKCGFIYADTQVSQDQLDDYYKNLSKYEDKVVSTGGGYNSADHARIVDTAKFIAEHLPNKSSRIIDIGCSNGGLLKEFSALGYQELTGVDPSLQCVNTTIQNVGCPCFHYSLFDIPNDLGKFDVVILTHVLEHILDVRGTIRILDRLLLPGGIIYIECPNASHYSDVIHAPLQEFNSEHINHFNERSFENLMGEFEFNKIVVDDKIMKVASDQDYHSVFGIFKKNPGAGHKLQFDNLLKSRIEDYIQKSTAIFDNIKKAISQLPPNSKIALYGVGQFSFKMIATDCFLGHKILNLFDNNQINVHKTLNGIEILPGSEMINEYRKQPFAIIISSLIYETQIRKSIVANFENAGLETPVILGFSRFL